MEACVEGVRRTIWDKGVWVSGRFGFEVVGDDEGEG